MYTYVIGRGRAAETDYPENPRLFFKRKLFVIAGNRAAKRRLIWQRKRKRFVLLFQEVTFYFLRSKNESGTVFFPVEAGTEGSEEQQGGDIGQLIPVVAEKTASFEERVSGPDADFQNNERQQNRQQYQYKFLFPCSTRATFSGFFFLAIFFLAIFFHPIW